MLSLTTAQRDLLNLLLAAEAPIGANALGEQLHLSARQIHYGLRDIEGWLDRRKAHVRNTPGLGVQIVCPPELRQQLQAELAAQLRFQLILTPEQRQQLLALILLHAHEPLVLTQIQQDLAVARATVFKNVELVDVWLSAFGLQIARRQHRGCWVEGAEFAKRQSLVALIWGDVPFERAILQVTHEDGIVFALTHDARLLPLVAQVDHAIRSWDCQVVKPVIAAAEAALGGRYTDEAVLALELAFAVQRQRVRAGQFATWSEEAQEWTAQQPIWLIAERIARELWPDLPADTRNAETVALALHLLCGGRDQPWSHGNGTNGLSDSLIDGLLADSAMAYATPELAHDDLLREGLESLVMPACIRQRFSLWAPPRPANDSHAARYSTERLLAERLARRVETSLGMALPPDAIDELTLLLRAAVVRMRLERDRRILVVCPSGIATTQLLLAQLKSRVPRLGTFEVLPLRELTAERIATADLIVTTVPLAPAWPIQIDIIHVHPMLKAEDIARLTQWMA